LFNLTSSCQLKGSDKAGIYCRYDCGPRFETSDRPTELGAFEPFNGEEKCWSFANRPGFGIGRDTDGINLLTKKKDREDFTITEFEVWEILNIENLVLQEPVEIKIEYKVNDD
jgi:hypothetical protein